MPDKPRSDLNKYLNAPHFVHPRGGIKRHNANKLNNSDGIRNIQSRLFYIHVTMELSRLNDWGGRQHDSPTPMDAHTHTHTHPSQSVTVVAFPASDSSGHSCGNVQSGTERGKLSNNLRG